MKELMKNNLFILKKTKMVDDEDENDDRPPNRIYYGVYHLPIHKDNMWKIVEKKLKGPLTFRGLGIAKGIETFKKDAIHIFL